MGKRNSDFQLPKSVFWILFFTAMFMGAFLMFMLDHPLVNGNAQWETNLSFISKQNIDAYCIRNGYDFGGASCGGIEVGFTCYQKIGDLLRTTCFQLEKLRP